MKVLCALIVALSCINASLGDGLKCTLRPGEFPFEWRDMVDPCTKMLEAQVKTEIEASMTYLAMGAHFSQDSVNRPGFAKFFFDSASEEREHAIKIIEYLLMRGQLTSDVSKLLKFPLKPIAGEWSSGVKALTEALSLETRVTRSIRKIIEKCEAPADVNFNDYHGFKVGAQFTFALAAAFLAQTVSLHFFSSSAASQALRTTLVDPVNGNLS
ncbi:Similar to FERH: Ferritin subunit (Aedes aegypti) [Cotesia congregata]|uniref:Ferritin n=1 Tax=Cotesia congregata TaxID=51543 RepID=A0A8J2N076_COTCN|nr:Similar to FERH: Ferritin subunit (Aedes aegypti) [Cotesia congregata]